MNTIIEIQGREAIPVRAVPLLSNWETMGSDALVMALAGDDHFYQFEGLQAFKVKHHEAVPIPMTYWENIALTRLGAMDDLVRAREVSHAAGLDEWRARSLKILPAGVFVWRSEFEPMHEAKYWRDQTVIKDLERGELMKRAEQRVRSRLHFETVDSDAEIEALMMEGFESEYKRQVVIDTYRHHWNAVRAQIDLQDAAITRLKAEKWDDNEAKAAELCGCEVVLATYHDRLAWLRTTEDGDQQHNAERRYLASLMAKTNSRVPVPPQPDAGTRHVFAAINREIDEARRREPLADEMELTRLDTGSVTADVVVSDQPCLSTTLTEGHDKVDTQSATDDWAVRAIGRAWEMIQESDGKFFPSQRNLAERIEREFRGNVMNKFGSPLTVPTIERALKSAHVSNKGARDKAHLNAERPPRGE